AARLLPLRCEGDVDGDGLAAPRLNLGREPPVPALLNLDAVRTFRHLDEQPLVSCRPLPSLAVAQHVAAGRLDANRERRRARRLARWGGARRWGIRGLRRVRV